MRKFILILVIILTLFFIRVDFANAQGGASLYLSPSSGTFPVGSTFDVSILIDTNENSINAVKLDLKFDPKKLQITSPTSGKSLISVWISQPTFSNIDGTAVFQGGIPSPGINTSSGLISTITFRAVRPGEAIISILDSSQVLLDDGKGTNILSSVGKGFYKIIIPPPKGPEVSSYTHPNQNKWYNNNSPTLSWRKEEGVTDFSYTIDHNFYGVPDDISEGSQTSVSYNNLEDGVWYFHIKAKKGGHWGGVTSYLLLIDTTPPASFKLSFKPTLRSPVMTSKEPIVYFVTTDALSGLDHYELKLINLNRSSSAGGKTGFFVEVFSPYKLPPLEAGEYEVIVRAFDRALNWKDADEKIEVVPSEKAFYVTKEGIDFWIFFLSWKKLILILLVLLTIISISIFLGYRRHKVLRQRRENIKQIKETARRNSEEIKKKLDGI